MDPIGARQRRGLAHQVRRDRERRTRCHDDAQHGARPRRHGRPRSAGACPCRMACGCLDHRIGRQAALALAQTHRAARGVEAQPTWRRPASIASSSRQPLGKMYRWSEAVVQPLSASSASPSVVERRMSSRPHAGPDRVERLEPLEQAGILRRGHGARQRLVQVVVGVDQAGQDDVAAQVEDLVGRRGQAPTSGPPARSTRRGRTGRHPRSSRRP